MRFPIDERLWLTLLCLCVASTSASFAVILSGKGQTPIDIAAPLPANKSGNLRTSGVKPDTDEKPFYDKLAPSERKTGSMSSEYNLSNKQGKYVGWFGIVRKIKELKGGQETLITVQHTYSDALTDSHMMTVSFFGDGDFQARLKGTKLPLLPLRLVRVYGKVKEYEGKLPLVEAEFVKEWDWRNFTFMDYGKPNTNPEWLKLLKVDQKSIYHPYPDTQYYLDRLGSAPPRLFDSLSSEQQLKYAQAIKTDAGQDSPLTAPENAPRYIGKVVTLTGPAGAPGVPGFKKAATYLDFKKGVIDRGRWFDSGVELLPLGTRAEILSFTTLPTSSVALYSVRPLSGPFKGQTWWLPGFTLDPK